MLAGLCRREGLRRMLRFGCVGLLNTAIAFGLYMLFSAVLSIYLSNVLSWSLACLFSYFMNRAWTFRAADTGFSPLLRFVCVNLASLGLGLITMYILASLGGGRIWSYVLSLPVTMTASYVGYRFWSFKKVGARNPP
ncbi:MAG: GtrA family protein [Cystobacterineae bacterium]|nr:GtrA family protein [Cystobacterineae bacterium]